jgi:hypothetical protein
MNDKITKQQIYSELTIRLDKLEYKLDKLLTLMGSSTVNNITVTLSEEDYVPEGLAEYIQNMWTKEQVDKFNNRPPQWPNESYIDYMKRIGELNTAQSDEESFREECK